MYEKIERPVTLQKPTLLSLTLTRCSEQNTLLLVKYIQNHINMKNVQLDTNKITGNIVQTHTSGRYQSGFIFQTLQH